MSTARILRMPATRRTVKLDDSAQSVAWLQREIFRSQKSYVEIASKAGISNVTVGNIASGTTQRPHLTTIIRIASVLGWSIYAEQD